MKPEKILITGALGMLGKAVVTECLEAYPSVDIILVDVLSVSKAEQIIEKCWPQCSRLTYTQASILSSNAMKSLLVGVTNVYHVAGIVSYKTKERELMMRINRNGTRELAKLASEAGVESFVYASSISSVSLSLGREATENDHPDILAPYLNNYSKSKLLAEHDFFEVKTSAMRKVAANLGVIVGHSAPMKSLVQTIAKMPIILAPDTYNSFVDVRDAARALVFLSTKGASSERYIVAPYSVKNSDFMSQIRVALGKNVLLTLSIPRKILRIVHIILCKLPIGNDSWRSIAEEKIFSNQKITGLGWKPQYSLQESISYLVAEIST